MSNYYYEMPNSPLFGGGAGIYKLPYVWRNAVIDAIRIWEEDDEGNVTYYKNKVVNPNTKVDLQEFFWIKLSAKTIRKTMI